MSNSTDVTWNRHVIWVRLSTIPRYVQQYRRDVEQARHLSEVKNEVLRTSGPQKEQVTEVEKITHMRRLTLFHLYLIL
jgi:hypothetical protein